MEDILSEVPVLAAVKEEQFSVVGSTGCESGRERNNPDSKILASYGEVQNGR
jgi:hypothetical protein